MDGNKAVGVSPLDIIFSGSPKTAISLKTTLPCALIPGP